MAIAVRICPDNMNSDDYERVIGELGEPDGRLYHAGYGDSEVEMFSVWDSRESWDAHSETLVNHLQANGVGVGVIEISPVHHHG